MRYFFIIGSRSLSPLLCGPYDTEEERNCEELRLSHADATIYRLTHEKNGRMTIRTTGEK